MKKNLQFYGILLLIPFMAFLSISFSGGPPAAGVTGSPGDGGADCTGCHTAPFGNFNASVKITTTIPTGGYALGQAYTITVTQTSTGAVDHGFQITAENAGAAFVGSFTITDATNTQLQTGADHVSHTHDGDSQSAWSFTWTAPNSDLGVITFYVASNAANGDGSAQGDQIVFDTEVIGGVLGINKAQLLNFSMYPNPSDSMVTLQLPTDVNQANVSIFDYLGKTLISKSINASNNTLDVSNLSTGIYFVRIQTDSKVGTKKLIIR